MKIEEHIKYWLESAVNDLEVAETLLKNQKYDWCLFIGHLVLEKTLKALYVRDNENQIPPRIHNLVRLAEQTSLNLTEEQRIFLDEVSDFNIETRYPDYKNLFSEQCTREFATLYFNKIKEFYKWLLSQLK
jgi:HEPN domain-containing protein